MDTGEMQELLTGYMGELDWTGGVTKDDVLAPSPVGTTPCGRWSTSTSPREPTKTWTKC
jgi:hypothetical protein